MYRTEQEWTVALALCALAPNALALANVAGWIGHEEVTNEFSSIYFLSLPFTLGFGAWALVRSTRTLSDYSAAGLRERFFGVLACILSVPAVILSAFGLLAIGGGGGG